MRKIKHIILHDDDDNNNNNNNVTKYRTNNCYMKINYIVWKYKK